MGYGLTRENLDWRERAREFAERVIRPVAAQHDKEQSYPTAVKESMAQEGFFKVWIPKEYGGDGAGALNFCIVVEELSRACGGIGILYAVNALGSFPLLLGGTPAQQEKYLPAIAKGECLCAFCLSEKGAGSDAGSLRTLAEKDGDAYIINGEKKWTTNGGVADLYTVFAVTNPQSRSRRISAFIVEKDTPGFEFTKEEAKMGIRCIPVTEETLKDCRIPAANLIGGKEGLGFRHAMATLDRARPGVAAQAVGLAQGAMEYALVYANRRAQFGQTLANFQMIQQMLADMAMKIEAARQLVYTAAQAVEAGDAKASKLAAMSKAFASDVAMEVTTNVVQIFGGYGYMEDYPVEKYMRDAKITQIYEGTNQVQRMVIARALQKEASKLDFLEKYIPQEEQYVKEPPAST